MFFFKRIKLLNIVIISLFLIISCKKVESEQSLIHNRKVNHPTPGNIPESVSKEIASQKIYSYPLLEYLSQNDESIKTAKLKNRDPENEMYGEIEGIVATNDGNLIVLDSKVLELIIVDKGLRVLKRYNLGGRGPGEFLRPQKIIIDKFENIYVADRYNRINKYIYENEIINSDNTFILDFVPEDMCIIDTTLYVRGVRVNDKNDKTKASIIHKYSSESGEYLGSIGKAYNSKNWLVVNQLSDGPIACDESRNSILYSFDYLPYLYSIDVEGGINWVSEVTPFHGLNIIEEYEEESPTVLFEPNGKYSEVIKGIVTDGEKGVLLQTEFRNVELSNIDYRSHYYDLKTGESFFLQTSLPLLHQISDKYLIGSVEYPYPDLQIIKY